MISVPGLESQPLEAFDRECLLGTIAPCNLAADPSCFSSAQPRGSSVPTQNENLKLFNAPRQHAEQALPQNEEQYRELFEALEAARNYSRHVIEAQEAERRRISGELHDQVGQILTALQMNLHSLRGKSTAPDIVDSLKKNIEMIDEAVDLVRDLSVDLRPLLLDDFGLVVALRWYLDRQAKNLGVPAKLNTRSLDEDDRFSSKLETACFRVVQEGLTNVVKHAHATRVSVMLERTGSDLILLITDDGVGFDIRDLRKGAAGTITPGLRGMEERVQSVGGSINIQSAPALGTEICARFPLQEAARTCTPTESRPTSLAKRTSSMSSG